VVAVQSGTLGRSEAYDRYMLSEEESFSLEEAFGQDGIAGLQAKAFSAARSIAGRVGLTNGHATQRSPRQSWAGTGWLSTLWAP